MKTAITALLTQKIKDMKKPFALWLLLPLAIYFSFGLYHLTQFETVDEHYWIYSNTNNNSYWNNSNGRIKQYWDAVRAGNWAATRINDKPGITLAYVSGIGTWLRENLDAQIATGAVASLSKIDKAEKVNLYFRFPILLFNGLFSLILFFLLKKLLKNTWIALMAISLILLSPIVLGISQIVNPDSLLWEFGFASILAYLIFLDEGARKYSVLASLFLGLSLLTKYSSVILFPFFLAVMLAYFVENIKILNPEELRKKIRHQALAYFLILAGALAIYAVFLPDNLKDFSHFLKGSVGFKGMNNFFLALFLVDLVILADAHFLRSRIFIWIAKKCCWPEKYFQKAIFLALPLIFALIAVNANFGNDRLYLFGVVFDASTRNFFGNFGIFHLTLMQFQPIVFSLSIITLFALLFAWLKNLINSGKFQWIIFVFSLFAIIFVAAMIQQKVPLSIRYSILLYPLLLTVAAIGIYELFDLERRGNFFKFTLFGSIILISAFSLWRIKPFYFNYMNSLLPNKYLVTDAWGYGGYETAEYLNALPDAGQARVWADYNGVCVFFNGRCSANDVTMDNIRRNARRKEADLPDFNYFVSSRRGSILSANLWNELKEDYNLKLIWESNINQRPATFVKIYQNNGNHSEE